MSDETTPRESAVPGEEPPADAAPAAVPDLRDSGDATAGAAASLVRLRGVSKSFSRGAEKIEVLRTLDLDVPRGEFFCLMGPSGSGKSTLLNLIGGLDHPDAGSVEVGDDRIDRLTGRELAAWRSRHVGFVFQFYNLMPVLSAERNVELPLLLSPLSRSERREQVATALSIVGLTERARHYPRQLSGGEQQRVGIARAIATDPTLLLCDEPTGDLDRKTGDGILDLLRALSDRYDKTVVMVTHDPHAAARADRTLYLDEGHLTDRPPA